LRRRGVPRQGTLPTGHSRSEPAAEKDGRKRSRQGRAPDWERRGMTGRDPEARGANRTRAAGHFQGRDETEQWERRRESSSRGSASGREDGWLVSTPETRTGRARLGGGRDEGPGLLCCKPGAWDIYGSVWRLDSAFNLLMNRLSKSLGGSLSSSFTGCAEIDGAGANPFQIG
jgi:hypothetical protein